MPRCFSFNPHALLAALLATPALPTLAAENEGFSGNLRAGYISSEDGAGIRTKSSAIGGKFGYVSPQWNSLSAGATIYATEDIGTDDEGSFFGADGDGYSILGEAYLQADLGDATLKGGRFEYDSPYADTDDIRMIPNTFQGVVLSNTNFADTTIHAGHLTKWAGVDTDKPEKFSHMNNSDGVSFIGAEYQGIESVDLQAWYYEADDYALLSYFEAIYSADNFELGLQYADQKDDTSNNSGPDGDAYGIYGSINISDFTLMAAYNDVDGTVTNGFGGGPFFTSADDLTIDGTQNQDALALGLQFNGIENLTLGLLNVDFGKGEDETDYYAVYEVNERLSFELIHADLHNDGNSTRLIANLSF